MRKTVLALFALFVSVSVQAAPNDLSHAITKTLDNHNTGGSQSTIVYGGKDISRSIVATANESAWTKHSILVG